MRLHRATIAVTTPTALIVEDDVQWLGIFRTELLDAGYQINFAVSRGDALDQIARPPFSYDLVILDVNLGDSLGGLAGMLIATRVAETGVGKAVVVVSGAASREELEEEYRELGPLVVGTFDKARFDLHEFRESLRRAGGEAGKHSAHFHPEWQSVEALWRTTQEEENGLAAGHALEQLAVALLRGIPGLAHHETRAVTPTAELDAVFVLDGTGPLPHDWGRLVIVECRNRKVPVDSASVRAFGSKLEEMDAKVGIVVSMTGLTGSEHRAAHGVANELFGRARRIILTVDREDLRRVVEERGNLAAMLLEKDMNIRLRRATRSF